MPVTQQNREIEIITPLGKDVLLLMGFRVEEELGRLFKIDVDLASTENISCEALLGKNVSIRMNLPEGQRFFNGHVSSISQSVDEGHLARYNATIHPWLWFLTRTSDCRIFQNLTVPDIIKQICNEEGFTDFKIDLIESYRTWDYCCQYRETDFNFLSRLMEQEGIYYYFTHEQGKHTLCLADSYSSLELTPGYEQISYYPPDSTVVRDDDKCISSWFLTKQIQPGAYVLNEYDCIRPKADLKVNSNIARAHSEAEYEIYDYPGEYVQSSDGDTYARTRIEELHAQYEQVQGHGEARGLACGGLFSLTRFPREEQNREYLVVSANHDIHIDAFDAVSGGGGAFGYTNSFTVIESGTPYRSARVTPKPIVQGPQTAVVVGPGGDEIYTDEIGRIKLQFHWDRYGQSDENSSCWVRVSQIWAGKTWGGIHIPRIGQEVIVEFLEGDPDRPIVTGCVYNGDQTPPYELPANKTQSGIKSRSSKGGSGANFNEIRFEDKKGEEQVYIHAEKNQDNIVENDETTSVGHDRTEDVGNDERIEVGNNQDLVVVVNRTIDVGNDHTEAIHGSMSLSVDRTKSEVVILNSAETVGIAKELSTGGLYQVTVGAAYNTTVGGAKTEQVGAFKGEVVAGAKTSAIGGNYSKTIGGKESVTVTKDRSDTVNGKFDETVKKEYTLKAKKITIQAEDEIVIKVGKAKIAMKKNGAILVEGKDLSLKASGKINQKASGDIIMKGSKIKEN